MSQRRLEFVYATTNHPCGKKLEGVVVARNSSVQTIDDIQKAVAVDIAKQCPFFFSAIQYQVQLFTLRGFPLSGSKSSDRNTLQKVGFASSGKIYVHALLHVPGNFVLFCS